MLLILLWQMGLVPDGRLLDLLDFALSADTVNTVRNLKELMTSGVDPLSLMSQLACLITSILAGGYKIPQGRCRRRFFRKNECKWQIVFLKCIFCLFQIKSIYKRRVNAMLIIYGECVLFICWNCFLQHLAIRKFRKQNLNFCKASFNARTVEMKVHLFKICIWRGTWWSLL